MAYLGPGPGSYLLDFACGGSTVTRSRGRRMRQLRRKGPAWSSACGVAFGLGPGLGETIDLRSGLVSSGLLVRWVAVVGDVFAVRGRERVGIRAPVFRRRAMPRAARASLRELAPVRELGDAGGRRCGRGYVSDDGSAVVLVRWWVLSSRRSVRATRPASR